MEGWGCGSPTRQSALVLLTFLQALFDQAEPDPWRFPGAARGRAGLGSGCARARTLLAEGGKQLHGQGL